LVSKTAQTKGPTSAAPHRSFHRAPQIALDGIFSTKGHRGLFKATKLSANAFKTPHYIC